MLPEAVDGIGWRSALEGRRCSGNKELEDALGLRMLHICQGCVNSVNIKEASEAVPG